MKNSVMQKMALAMSCAAVGLAVFNMTVKDARIHELTEERDIYASRFQNWAERAMRDEEAISERDDLLDKLLGEADAVFNGEIKFEDAGEFHCTAYCTEKFPHECGTGTGITASGEPVMAGWSVAADEEIFPLGTVLYIEGVGLRVVQDRGVAVKGQHLDIAVAGTHEDALKWDGYGEHKVWVIERADSDG